MTEYYCPLVVYIYFCVSKLLTCAIVFLKITNTDKYLLIQNPHINLCDCDVTGLILVFAKGLISMFLE